MIELFVQSRYHVNREVVRAKAQSFLKKVGLDPDGYIVSIGIIGDRKMAELHKKYAQKSGTTPVLAFTLNQAGLDNKYHGARNAKETSGNRSTLLGEIVISYPQTLIFAADENKLVDEKIGEFVEHGLTNLLQAK